MLTVNAAHDRTGTTQNVKSSNPTTPSEGETAFAARPDHDGDTAVPPINRHSAPDVSKSKSNVPDLSSIKARTPPGQFDESIASAEAFITKPFSLQSPAYADTDIPLPEPYNAAYPHPLTAYASPGVNPATVRVSGYGKALAQLIRTDPEKVLGAILASSKHKDIVVPALALHTTIGDGNGIPERLWERFDSLGAARLPVGVAGVSPFAQSAPRFLQALSHCPDRNPGAAADCRVSDTPYTLGQPRNLETYAQHRMRHALSANDLDGRASAFHPTIRWYSDETTPTESNFASSGEQGQQHIDSTPFFKTDICVSWEAHGLCRYGMQCQVKEHVLYLLIQLTWPQYAHGLHDMRNLSKQPFTFGSSPMDPDHGTPQDKQSAYGNQLTTSQAESRPVPIPTAPRLEPRRLSAPSSRLPTVAEHDHDIPLPFAHWHQSPISVPPIGAERSSPPRSQDLAKCLSSSFGRAETAPSLSRQSGFTSTENKVTPRGSSSSLSTSSSSRYSLITGASEGTSVCWSPIDTDMVAPVASKPSKSDVPPPLDFLGSASLDFSTGKSIWC